MGADAAAAARAPETLARLPVGFHGDRHLLELVDRLMEGVEVYVETGANVASTLRYVAERFPRVACIACEPDPQAFAIARDAVAGLPNVSLLPLRSQELLEVLRSETALHDRPSLFWLDAHGYGFQWPLREEIAFVTSAFRDPLILVDDFLVPGEPEFGYDSYDGQECSYAHVEDVVQGPVEVLYPGYAEHTSPFHPLRGWGLIARPGRVRVPASLARAEPAPREVAVGFHGFWPGFTPDAFVRRHPYLARRWTLVPADEPDVVFASVFAPGSVPPASRTSVFYTGEPVVPDLTAYDFAVSFSRVPHERHLRLPNFVPRLRENGRTLADLVGRTVPEAPPPRFCSFLYGRSVPHRDALFDLLSTHGRVDAPGDARRNMMPIGPSLEDKLAFLSIYRFTIACENTSLEGYVSEKLVEALLAGTVPLYLGDPEVALDLNPGAFIGRHDFRTDEAFVRRVLEVENDPDAWRAIRAQPAFAGDRIPDHLRDEAAAAFFDRVLEDRGEARRARTAARVAFVRPARPGPRFYGRNGEDAVAVAAFDDLDRGYYAEIGALDGRRFSSTLALEERGWHGICVEAHAGYVARLRANRPGSRVVHAAAGAGDADAVTFYANARGSLSTVPWLGGLEEQTVPLRTVSSILDEERAPHVDVLSVDCEGADADVIRGIDLARHRPSLIVVGAAIGEALEEIDGILLPAGYVRPFTLGNNAFYFADPVRAARVAARTIECEVVHTAHPLDDAADEVVQLVIPLRRAGVGSG